MSEIEIEIDGKVLTAKPDSMVIQVADEAGIYIPRFCYHKHLSIAANCRMCLVEVEKSPKPLPACATPVMPGMKVFTRSAKALAAQKSVMEFLLINHPLDCPICDQGGECELQDLSMGYGSPESYYTEGKRSIKDKDLGPLIATDMTRCIQCTRCVRFGDEVAGLRELGATGRGEHMEIGTYIEHAMHSEVSGNIIDICPVGALTSKPFKFTARAWELEQHPSIAPHDCLGTNINVHMRATRVMRVVPRENSDINETWISDRDRFSYQGLYHPDRIEKPMIREHNKWRETDWSTALRFAVAGLQKVIAEQGPDQIAALASPNATTEEFYLLQKLMRQLGSNHIDHRLRQVDFSDQESLPMYPGLNSIADLEHCDRILLIGSNIQKEQPGAALRIRKAVRKGAKVMAVNMMDYQFHFNLSEKNIVAPHHFTHALEKMVNDTNEAITKQLQEGKNVIILVGAMALNHPEAAHIRTLAAELAKNCHATVGILTEGANAAGAFLAGAIPHRKPAGNKLQHPGLNAQDMLLQPRKAYFFLNVEPDLDFANPPAVTHALEQADFVISLSLFKNPVLEQYANVILPIAPFTETSGTFVNATGEWQSFNGMAASIGESRPAWKVLRVLGNFLHLEGFDYQSSAEILQELKAEVANAPDVVRSNPATYSKKTLATELSRIGEIPLYSNDSLVRRADALQATQPIIEGELAAVRIHSATAEKWAVKTAEMISIKQQKNRIQLPVIIDDRVPKEALYIPSGISATVGLSELFGSIEIHK